MKKVLFILLMGLFCFGCSNTAIHEQKEFDKDLAVKNISTISFSGEDFHFSDESCMDNTKALDMYGIELDRAEQYAFDLSSDVVNPSMYLILKPKEDEKEILEFQVKEMFDKYYSAYNNYYPKEAKMIDDRLEKEYEGYLIYIVSYDNEKVFQVIKESFQ